MFTFKDLVGKKVVNKARGEGTVVSIDAKNNIEVAYGDKKIKHPCFTLKNGILKLADEELQKEVDAYFSPNSVKEEK